MSQGSINMPAAGRSPIEGIMQALQAVHQFYGIDTEKAQQKLLASQTKKADAEGEKESFLAEGIKDIKAGKYNTPAALSFAGKVPMSGGSATPAVNPQAPSQAPNFTPVDNSEAPKNMSAMSDTNASDAPGSPVIGKIPRLSDLIPKYATPVSSPAQSAPSTSSRGGVVPISATDGSMWRPSDKELKGDQDYQKASPNLKKKTKSINLPSKIKKIKSFPSIWTKTRTRNQPSHNFMPQGM